MPQDNDAVVAVPRTPLGKVQNSAKTIIRELSGSDFIFMPFCKEKGSQVLYFHSNKLSVF